MTAATDAPGVADTKSLTLILTEASELCDGVRALRLESADSATLPSFTPGSHLVLDCGTTPQGTPRRNSYSMTGPELEPDHYSVSVQLDRGGRGGSRWIHGLELGAYIRASRPRSVFAPVLTARHHLLIAGGIGVTPILSHARAAVQWGRSFTVLYVWRGPDAAHLDELRELCGSQLHVFASRRELWAHLGPALLEQPLGTHLYTCGPSAMIDDVEGAAQAAGWPSARIHYERFGGADLDPGQPFVVALRGSGKEFEVPSGTSVLETLEQHGVTVPNLCRQGVCGECRVPVADGSVAHRDLYLTDEEKSCGTSMMACVSRADGSRLELDL